MNCNICGCAEFVDMNRRVGVRCKECDSLERTRVLWKFIEQVEFPAGARILHIAPERGLSNRLKAATASVGGAYVAADIQPRLYENLVGPVSYIDLCDLESWPSNQFDLIVHSHVLEHVPCNIFYTMHHLHRMLTDQGRHVCVVPFMPGRWDECFGEIGKDERNRRFGQDDHVRRFGSEDVHSHLGKLVNLPENYDLTASFAPAELAAANIPEKSWRGYTTDTVLSLRREDMLTFA